MEITTSISAVAELHNMFILERVQFEGNSSELCSTYIKNSNIRMLNYLDAKKLEQTEIRETFGFTVFRQEYLLYVSVTEELKYSTGSKTFPVA